MRTQKQLASYESIIETLSEPGCPFCRFLKDFQAMRLQHHGDRQIRNLCNFHAWALAAVQNALTAAQIFIDLVEAAASGAQEQSCDLCREILAEEDRRTREFAGCAHRKDVADWLRFRAAFCIPHGVKLRRMVQPVAAAHIDMILENHRKQLVKDLQALRNNPELDRPGWGSLGRAAEFLVSQRGLHV